jgi:GAF domain-containing protein
MTLDPATGRHLLTPIDEEIPQRAARLRELGLGDQPDREFDAFAAELAHTASEIAQFAGTPYAMVNLITDRQYFAGLYTPSGVQAGAGEPADDGAGVGRVMSRDHGYCPHVVVRRKALVLDDVCDYPRFAGNAVVDEIGIRTYMGAPLIDPRTGTALGTVCVVDTEPRPWGREGLDFIKDRADRMMKLINRRAE